MFRWLLAWTIFNVIVQLNPISHQQKINIPLIIRNKIPNQCQCFSNHKLSMLSQHLCQVKSGRNLDIIMSHEFEARHMPKHPRKEKQKNNFRRRICDSLEILCQYLMFNQKCRFELPVLCGHVTWFIQTHMTNRLPPLFTWQHWKLVITNEKPWLYSGTCILFLTDYVYYRAGKKYLYSITCTYPCFIVGLTYSSYRKRMESVGQIIQMNHAAKLTDNKILSAFPSTA